MTLRHPVRAEARQSTEPGFQVAAHADFHDSHSTSLGFRRGWQSTLGVFCNVFKNLLGGASEDLGAFYLSWDRNVPTMQVRDFRPLYYVRGIYDIRRAYGQSTVINRSLVADRLLATRRGTLSYLERVPEQHRHHLCATMRMIIYR
jgi:hypothetical protein